MSLVKENIQNIYTLSPMQEGMFFHSRYNQFSSAYLEQMSYRLQGHVDPELVKKSLDHLFERYDILRTVFIQKAQDRILQVVLKQRDADFYFKDISTDKDDDPEHYIKRYKADDRRRIFDLSKDVLMRVAVIRIGINEYEFIWTHHHILMDGWCLGILIAEFFEIYTGYMEKRSCRLPEVTQYREYIRWLQQQDRGKSANYWKQYLEGYEEPVGIPGAASSGKFPEMSAPKSVELVIDRETTSCLNRMIASHRVTLNTLIQTSWGILLAKYTGTTDVVFGAVTTNRPGEIPNVEIMVGLFINTIPVRIGYERLTTFNQLIKDIQERALESEPHHYFPLAEIQALCLPGQHLFDHIMACQNFPTSQQVTRAAEQKGESSLPPLMTVLHVESFEMTEYDLCIMVRPRERLRVEFIYNVYVYEPGTIERVSRHFQYLLAQLVNHQYRPISEILLLNEEEKKQLLFDFNDTQANYPKNATIYELFEKAAEKTPDAIAILFPGTEGNQNITYKELNRKAQYWAPILREKGMEPESIVALVVEPSIDMIVGILGILKAGGAYLPIDPLYPLERARYILADSNVRLVLTTTHLPQDLPIQGDVIYLDIPFARKGPKVPLISTPSNLAYIIYTSGTTGKPKGVLIEHKNVVRLLFNDRNRFDFNHSDTWTMFHSYCFDFSVWEMYGALLYGGKLVLVPRLMARDPGRFLGLLKKEMVTVLNQTPSSFYNLLDEELKNPRKEICLRYIIFGGDILKPARLEPWRKKYPGIKLINMFGITETTVHVTFKEIGTPEVQSNSKSVGKPIPTLSTYIMDNHRFLLPLGSKGEIYVGGPGVARGYLNRVELSQEKFVENPYRVNELLYCSGDQGQYTDDGEILYWGRGDHQFKIRGYRIEPGEIERTLLTHPGIKDAVVMMREEKEDNDYRYLCAYIVSKEGPENRVKPGEFREYLSGLLPHYMIPAHFVNLPALPLTHSGKVDKRALISHLDLAGEPGENKEDIIGTSKVERMLLATCRKILPRQNISIHDNFFEAGGDSIKAIQIASSLNKEGYKIEIKDIFQYPEISQLAERVTELKHLPDQWPITGQFPLTPVQEHFFRASIVDIHHYNQAVMIHPEERLDGMIVEAVFAKIQNHHDALRMTYHRENSRVVQFNRGVDYPFFLEEKDFRGREDADALMAACANRIQTSICLDTGPLMKLALFHLDQGDCLLVVIHHLVVDGVSWRILFEDIETLFRQYRKGEALVLPQKTDSFKTWSQQLTRYAAHESFLKEKEYWAGVESTPVSLIPLHNYRDTREETNPGKNIEIIGFQLEKDETERLLTQTNEAFGTEINDLLLTGLGLGVHQTFGCTRIPIFLEGHGREEIFTHINISRTIGWFTSIYPVILDMTYENHLTRQIIVIKEQLHRIPHKGIGYGILKYITPNQLKSEIQFQLKPQFLFNYLGQFDTDVDENSFRVTEESIGQSVSPAREREFELEINGMITGQKLALTLAFDKCRYSMEKMEILMQNYKSQLTRIISFCAARKEKKKTPVDFTWKELSIPQLERIQTLLDNDKVIEDIYPLTPMQEGFLYHSLADSSSASYFEQMSYHIVGDLDMTVIKKSYQQLVDRYDILRTLFVSEAEGIKRPFQVVIKEQIGDFLFESILHQDSRERKKSYLREFKIRDRSIPFNPLKGPLMRLTIFQTGEKEYEFVWSHHHLLMDGWCIGIVISDFFELYESFIQNREHRLSPVKPFSTYIRWLEERDQAAAAAYWQNYLDGYPEAVFPPAHKDFKSMETKYKSRDYIFYLDSQQTHGLNGLAAKNRATLSILVRAIWGILLGHYNDTRDTLFGAVVSGRPPEIEGIDTMVGLFINTVPVRIKHEPDTPFKDLLQRLQQDALESEPFQYFPLAETQSLSPLKYKLLNHILIFENYPLAKRVEGARHSNLELSGMELFEQTNYDFNLSVIPGEEQMTISFLYNSHSYDHRLIEPAARQFKFIIEQILTDKTVPIGKISLLSPAEKEQVLREFNSSFSQYPRQKTSHRVFEDQVDRNPDYIALTFHNIQLTYRELDEASCQLAQNLQSRGIQPDSIVAIRMERSVEMIIGILAILKAGGVYLPIEPDFPGERVKYMLNDSNANLVLSHSGKMREAVDISDLGRLPVSPCPREPQAGDLAYIIYTSGSTGKPKGVLVKHSSVVHLIYSKKKLFHLTSRDRVLLFSSICFDVSVEQIFITLFTGAALILIDKDTLLKVSKFEAFINRNAVTQIHAVPSFIAHIDLNNAPQLKRILSAGEVCPLSLAKKYCKTKDFYNDYGPTETTVISTSLKAEPGYLNEGISRLPIGSPIGNTTVYLFDREQRLVPIGVTGEIYIGGDGVTRGYLNRPELTSENFIANPLGEGDRLYRTGDLARWLPGGNIEFIGRKDNQVKIRGYRVELGEIEHLICRLPQIEEAAVVARTDTGGDTFLCAYYVPGGDLENVKGRHNTKANPPGTLIKKYLGSHLPPYMIPTFFVGMEKIPRTPGSKVDRKALPPPSQAEVNSDRHDSSGPRDLFEITLGKIWEEILGINGPIHSNADFFQMGGHSLKVIRLVSQIHRRMHIKCQNRDIFNAPTLGELAKCLREKERVQYISITPAPLKEYYPLSSPQKRLFWLHQLDKNSLAYHISLAVKVNEQLDVSLLEHVFLQLIQRHQGLRTSFEMVDDQPVQRPRNQVEFNIRIYEQITSDTSIGSILRAFIRPFDLSQPPLFRIGLIKTGEPSSPYIMMVDMHHIISDEVALDILMEDFSRLYAGQPLPLLKFQYTDYSQWMAANEKTEIYERQEIFWLKTFQKPLPQLNIPTDFDRPLIQVFEGRNIYFAIPENQTKILEQITIEEGCTMFMLLLTIYNILLAKISRQEDIIVGTPVIGRSHPDLEEVIGIFINTLALRNFPTPRKAFREFLQEVKDRTLDAFENQHYPFENLVDKLGLERDRSRNPLFTVGFGLERPDIPDETHQDTSNKNTHPKFTPYPWENRTAKVDLTLNGIYDKKRLVLHLEYCTKLFKEETIHRLIAYFKEIIAAVAEERDRLLSEIEISHEFYDEPLENPDFDFDM
jgi:iturin family lipopeptide synthetase B